MSKQYYIHFWLEIWDFKSNLIKEMPQKQKIKLSIVVHHFFQLFLHIPRTFNKALKKTSVFTISFIMAFFYGGQHLVERALTSVFYFSWIPDLFFLIFVYFSWFIFNDTLHKSFIFPDWRTHNLVVSNLRWKTNHSLFESGC